jgi:hypothetical protein
VVLVARGLESYLPVAQSAAKRLEAPAWAGAAQSACSVVRRLEQ